MSSLITLLIIGILLLYVISIFNQLVKLKNRFQNAFAQIEVQLKRRYDLIPNLVETAKGYMSHERETLEAVIQARNSAFAELKVAANNPSDAGAISHLASAESSLQGAMSKFNMVMESYPELKANENMMQLAEELASTENKVSFARQAFNDAVTAYNSYKQSFPPVFLAGFFGHQQDAKLLEFADTVAIQAAPKVSFLSQMAVDFFEAQDQARRNTKLLVLLFGLAVLSLLVLTNLLLCITLGVLEPEQTELLFSPNHPDFWSALPWKAMSISSLAMLLVIAVVVLLKKAELNKGGRVVAEALGGERIDPQNANPQQKVLLNVVAEMAIAAGVSVPPVYLLPENSINAFAAGYSPADAVIGMTQGCLDLLSRDELQGVVAHEFSHILNGDMRMNIRLIALLHGILFIGHAGYYLLRSGGRTGAVYSAGRSSKNNGGGLIGLALGLMVLGYLGSFFGNLIKAAVSRQREFLADASAVQFTRNPQGIAGALKAIGGASLGSRVRNPNADEMSHLFFGEAISRWTSLFATHPPLAERIKKIEPSWLGQFPSSEQLSKRRQSPDSNNSADATAGQKNSQRQQQATSVLAALPALLLHSSQHPPSAPALLCACLVQPEQLHKHWHLIKELGSSSLLQDVDKLYDQVVLLAPRQKLQLLQLLAPSLKQLSAQQFAHLFELCEAMVKADGQQDLLETSILAWLKLSVGVQFDASLLHRHDRASRLHQVQNSALQLLSLCAAQSAEPAQAWQAGLAALALPADTPQPEVSTAKMLPVFAELIAVAPMLKKQLAQMLEAAVLADKKTSENEALLLQLLSMLLEIPKNSTPLTA